MIECFAWATIMAAIGFSIGVVFSAFVADKHWKEQCLKRNHIEYYLNEYNKKKWRWK